MYIYKNLKGRKVSLRKLIYTKKKSLDASNIQIAIIVRIILILFFPPLFFDSSFLTIQFSLLVFFFLLFSSLAELIDLSTEKKHSRLKTYEPRCTFRVHQSQKQQSCIDFKGWDATNYTISKGIWAFLMHFNPFFHVHSFLFYASPMLVGVGVTRTP